MTIDACGTFAALRNRDAGRGSVLSRRFVIVAVPQDKRVLGFVAALRKEGLPTPVLVPWQGVLSEPAMLRGLGQQGDWLRVESPGADSLTWHALARQGGFAGVLSPGQWRPGRAWFAGLSQALRAIDQESSHLVATHPTEHILTMTDKLLCAERLQAAGVPVPETYPAPPTADCLREFLSQRDRHAVFIKPRWGSSGAGILAYRCAGHREQLTTTARLENGCLINEKRLRSYRDRESIDRLFRIILSDGAVVQRWIPKAGTAAGPFDLRVLVINGQVAQRIARVGRGTITNLHIDAKRLDAEQALQSFGAKTIAAVYDVCRRAAACFPGQLAVGVDVMVDPAGRPFVLECNAWGDYLPRLLSDGRDSYESQVHALFGAAA